LTLLGDLLRELGDLMEANQAQLPAGQPAELAQVVTSPAPPPVPAAEASPDLPPDPDAPSQAPVAPPAASRPSPVAEGLSTSTESLDDALFLACEQGSGRIVIPWSWVAGTRLSPEGSAESFTLSDGHEEREMQVGRVLGLFTRREIVDMDEPARWIASVAELEAAPPPAPEPVASPSPEPEASRMPAPLRPAIALAPEKHTHVEPCPSPEQCRAWIASPSALARRFLMRHLVDLGFEVHEARDLDDPMLPADLKGVVALFLDESLLEDWRTRSQAAAGSPPLVLLTVDGALSVPPDGTCPPQGAVLPRPFERSEVERVVHWLGSLRRGARSGGSSGHGDEEDDTWLFADPFGATRAGEHSDR
jgi:hypothetical protein